MIEFKGEEYEWFQEVMCRHHTGATVFGPFELVGLRGDGDALVLDGGLVRSFEFIATPSVEPKLIPFTQETFPKCNVWVREVEPGGSAHLVSSVELDRVGFGLDSVFYSTLLSHYEISIDNRHSWQAAGY